MIFVVFVGLCAGGRIYVFAQQIDPKNKSLAADARSGMPPRLGEHYLMLINTAIARLLKPEAIAEFDKSPYDGLAVAFHYNYDTAPVFSSEMMGNQLLDWKQITKKDLWPWVYINRMIGAGESFSNERVDVPYFRKIRGIDLEDNAGARRDFLDIWRNALRIAKDTNAPGVVLDLEFYNYHKEYDIAEMSTQTGKSPAQILDLLQQLGARLADIAAEQQPDAVIWMPFTGFTHKDFKRIEGASYYPTPVYISTGLLDQIQRRNYRLKAISGGEGSLGYCHENLDQLRTAIRDRAATFAPVLKQYAGILELAGTLTLWDERSHKSGFVAEGDCGKASAANIDELAPYLAVLFKTYRYNWVYGSSDGNYFPFDSRYTKRFNVVISQAKSTAYASQSH
jgi:hypothetical protein